MNQFNPLFVLIILFSTVTFALDEAEIQPPPMPEYMKKHNAAKKVVLPPGVKEKEATQADEVSQASVDPTMPSAEVVKDEFIQAATDAADVSVPPVAPEEKNPVTMFDNVDVTQDDIQPQEDELAATDEYQMVDAEVEDAALVANNEEDFEQAEIAADTQETQASLNKEETPEKEEDEGEEKLAAVEEKLEIAEQEAEQRLEVKRQPTSQKKFKAGMYKFSKKCTMHSEASSSSDAAGSIRPGRKLWIDAHNDSWHKAYKKSGAVYISADCLTQ